MASDLLSRYQGVRFKGERSAKTYIEKTVIIHPGATIYLSQDVQISGNSIIGGKAIIEGGRIRSSRVYGRVYGGSIEDTDVDIFATISGGIIRHCFILDESQVNNGTLHSTTLRNKANFSGKQATGSEISGNSQVTNGWLQDSIVIENARITGGEVVESRISGNSRVTGGLIERSVIQGDVTVNGGTYSDATVGNIMSLAMLHKPEISDRSVPRVSAPTSGPPPEIIDKTTGKLFEDPVCTITGETQSKSGPSKEDGHKLYENIALGDIIQRWKHFESASCLVQMRGCSVIPFKLPSFMDPITSQPIKTAVLCSCGNTFDQTSIERWFYHYQLCPFGCSFPKDGFYPNTSIQRLLERAILERRL
uniref:U-box domain-containing protein 20 n=1 Tax=Talaromyces marneffei PM1 TaxID=1077442 RepID=A0A093UUM8_TALMA